MKKRIMRYGKVIEATVYREVEGSVTGKMIEMHVDSEVFNDGIFKGEPTDKHYEEANKWADEVIALHKRNTE
jgi:hypothetical protein